MIAGAGEDNVFAIIVVNPKIPIFRPPLRRTVAGITYPLCLARAGSSNRVFAERRGNPPPENAESSAARRVEGPRSHS